MLSKSSPSAEGIFLLPPEILISIAMHLSPEDTLKLAKVCKEFRYLLINSTFFWKKQFERIRRKPVGETTPEGYKNALKASFFTKKKTEDILIPNSFTNVIKKTLGFFNPNLKPDCQVFTALKDDKPLLFLAPLISDAGIYGIFELLQEQKASLGFFVRNRKSTKLRSKALSWSENREIDWDLICQLIAKSLFANKDKTFDLLVTFCCFMTQIIDHAAFPKEIDKFFTLFKKIHNMVMLRNDETHLRNFYYAVLCYAQPDILDLMIRQEYKNFPYVITKTLNQIHPRYICLLVESMMEWEHFSPAEAESGNSENSENSNHTSETFIDKIANLKLKSSAVTRFLELSKEKQDLQLALKESDVKQPKGISLEDRKKRDQRIENINSEMKKIKKQLAEEEAKEKSAEQNASLQKSPGKPG